jgi:hypothetical protein
MSKDELSGHISIINLGHSVTFRTKIFPIDVTEKTYKQAYHKFSLAAQSVINTYRQENGGVTPDMVALEMEVKELADGYMKEINGVSFIRDSGMWIPIDNKGFGPA